MSTTIQEYYENAKEAMQNWIALHTDPVAWTENWATEGWQFLLEQETIGTDYFSFDIKAACVQEVVKDELRFWNRCSICGNLFEDGEECENDQDEPDYELTELGENDLDELESYYEGFEPNISDDLIQEVMEKQGFEAFTEGTEPVFREVLEEIRNALDQLENASTREELLSALVWANHVQHVTGNVLQDYSNLEYKIVDKVSQNGLSEVFGQDEIDLFLDELFPQ